MELRALRRDDSDALLEMWNATARFDPLTPGLLAEKLWGDDAFDPGMALVCEDGGLLTGFAMGVLRRAHGGDTGVIKLMAVAADRRRLGIGSRLLAELEAALRARGATAVRVCESAPNYLTPGVDARYSAAPHFFSERGYRRIGEACNMTVELPERDFDTADAERIAGRDGIRFHRAGDADDAGLMELLRGNWPTWVPEVRAALQNRPASLYVAVRGDDVLAFAAFDANNRGTGWFGPMGTAPTARRRGIGHVLLFRCLADMAAQGHRYATIPWVDPVDFYRQCAGAAVSRIFHRYEKVLTS
ncbi:MAG: GNAT family N-acetyltransferase [Xanthomonadales bacterium]